MNKRRRLLAMLIIIGVSCIIMAFIEIMLKPGYFVKSIVKIVLFLLFPLAYAKTVPEASYKHLFKIQKKHIRDSIILGIGIFGFILLSYFTLGRFFDFSRVTSSLENDLGITKDNFIFVALYISVVNSLLEEFFFRGFAFIELKSLVKRNYAMLISAISFSLYHVSMISSWFSPILFVLLIISLVIGGIIFNLLNEKSGTIYASWMVHMFANFAINTIGLLLFSAIKIL